VGMWTVLQILVRLATDFVEFVFLACRSRRSIEVENLVLRRLSGVRISPGALFSFHSISVRGRALYWPVPVPGSLAFAVLCQVLGFHKGLQVFLDSIAVGSRELDDLTDRQSSVLFGEFEDL
jgi:glucose uptake protein GlcU